MCGVCDVVAEAQTGWSVLEGCGSRRSETVMFKVTLVVEQYPWNNELGKGVVIHNYLCWGLARAVLHSATEEGGRGHVSGRWKSWGI